MSYCPCAVANPTVSVLRLSHYTNTAGDCLARPDAYKALSRGQSPCVLAVLPEKNGIYIDPIRNEHMKWQLLTTAPSYTFF